MRRKLLFLIPSLGGGGAERVLSTLLNRLDRRKFDITLALIKGEGVHLDALPRDIHVIDLQASRARWAALPLVRTIRRERPDVVFCAMGYLNIMVAGLRPLLPQGVRLIARETIIPSLRNQEKKRTRLLNWLYRALYPKFDKIVCQSNDMRDDLITNYSVDRAKIVVVHNPVDVEKIRWESASAESADLYAGNGWNLVAAGRLEHQKGFDLLLQAFSQLEPERYSLTILGTGSLQGELEDLARRLTLGRRVRFVGYQANPYPYFAQADAFVLSSRFEGFPNVVLEAMSCGTPVVAFACPGGVNEIIHEGVNGTLVPPLDPSALASAIRDTCAWNYDSERIFDTVAGRFEASSVTKRYEALLLSL